MMGKPFTQTSILIVAFVWALVVSSLVFAENDPAQFRIGFSASVFTNLNENDAMAAVRIWTQVLVEEKNIPADPKPGLFNGVAEIKEALLKNEVDCINLSTVEYYQLRDLLTRDEVIAAVVNNSITEEYVIVVNRSSNIENIRDLQGKSLTVLETHRTTLARIWLQTVLAHSGFSDITEFFKKIEPFHKAGKAVLPVFFKQFDAGLVTRSSLEVMVELNPQLGQQLKIIATSPPYVPVVFSFRGNYDAPVKTRLLEEISNWHLSPAGRQIITIFQTDGLTQRPVSCLDEAFALLTEHQRLFQPDLITTGR